MRVCAGKTLAVWSKLAVENRSVTLPFNLEVQRKRLGKAPEKRVKNRVRSSPRLRTMLKKCMTLTPRCRSHM